MSTMVDKRLKYFCNNCKMGLLKKEVKRHTKLDHVVIEVNKTVKDKPPEIKTFDQFKNQVLKDVKNE